MATDLATLVDTTSSDANGFYIFDQLLAGDYVVKVVDSSIPSNKKVTIKNNAVNDLDSDFDPSTFLTDVIQVNPQDINSKDHNSIDLGLYTPNRTPIRVCAPVAIRKVK
ncbi:MAG: SdrD B-like domain-containing protein [Saprospiraceae bacterium]